MCFSSTTRSKMSWCDGSSGVLGAWTTAAGHTQQAQLLGAVERNRLELLDDLTVYYCIVLRTSTCCLNGSAMVADVAETDW